MNFNEWRKVYIYRNKLKGGKISKVFFIFVPSSKNYFDTAQIVKVGKKWIQIRILRDFFGHIVEACTYELKAIII